MIAGHVGFVGLIDKVFGRFGIDLSLDEIVHAFHMPMFFFVSGYLFSRKEKTELSTLNFLKHKARTLLLPYVVFGFLHYFIWLLFYREGDPIQPLYSLLVSNTGNMPIAGALWFLTALFFASSAFFLADRYIKKPLVRYGILLVIATVGCMETGLLPFRLPWTLGPAMVGTGFMLLGHLFRKKESAKLLNSFVFLLAAAMIALVLIYMNGSVNMRKGIYGIAPLFYINATVTSVVLLQFAKKLESWSDRVRLLTIINRGLTGIAAKAMVVVCCNQLVIRIIFSLLILPVSGHIYRGIVFTLTVACLCVISIPIYRSKMRLIVGQ